ncbi:plastocyanin/azurin family copper-binding protein [Caldalkalibacillus thermarum]|uniref:plastocyanin/azurin family copper-binding protein n=1 Tax=Caldalkalibacillus thermarum TaxID=296745 RepID=UPI000C1C2351|nr:plastocyanin/azurin family copper-binding protein [Caldalkalibacillus thermarum]
MRTDNKQPDETDEQEPIEILQPMNDKQNGCIGCEGLPPTSYVQQDMEPDKKFTLTLTEGDVYLGKGVLYSGFTIDDKIPGPTLIVRQNEIVEIEVVNTGKIPHGMSIHAAYTQTSKYVGQIGAGETKSVKFKATYPGVYMYHCAPGGHAIPMHTLFGQYGMLVVLPDDGYELEKRGEKPDVELYLIQHEMYKTGKDAITGDPLYVLFNGQLFRYVEDPIKVRPGDKVRIYFLNVGPNIISTLHIVGVVWDHVYWQGHPDNVFVGGQTVLAGPSDSWVIDFRIPEDEGNYLLVTHAFGSATRGAIGVFSASYDHEEVDNVILADGPTYTEEELTEFRELAERIISPYEPTDIDEPYIITPEQQKATVEIIGNSFYPKVLKVPVGTEVEWINEDIFTYAEGEFAGIHDVAVTSGPEMFASPLLGHGEKFSYTFTEVGEYEYICVPHPYMKGKVIVYDPAENSSSQQSGFNIWYALPLAVVGMIVLPIIIRKFRN